MHRLLSKALYLTHQKATLKGSFKTHMTAELSYNEVKKIVFRIPLQQMLLGVVIAAIFFFTQGQLAGMAALAGAFISTLGSLVFALMVFLSPVRDERQIKSRMMTGEILKILTVVVLFYIAIVVLKLAIMPLMLGFIATFIAFWVALLTAFK